MGKIGSFNVDNFAKIEQIRRRTRGKNQTEKKTYLHKQTQRLVLSEVSSAFFWETLDGIG